MTRKATAGKGDSPVADLLKGALAWLERHGSRKRRNEMGPRYGIHADRAWGVAMADMQKLARALGRNHELALALWDNGWYEARMLATLVDDPARVTAAQMDRWCRDFDNWAICDTACFKLFDQTPHALGKVVQWARKDDEFVKRAAFALLGCVALHDRTTGDAAFAGLLPLIEKAAGDERNFVKKSLSWALRAVGRRSGGLHAPSVAMAKRLAVSPHASARWVGKDALRDLTGATVARRLAARSGPAKPATRAKAKAGAARK
jgi:3-methyladenine DNA glycosylase AlkD